jgi:energy-coupling factor transporter ATP-binding protein EcfA2
VAFKFALTGITFSGSPNPVEFGESELVVLIGPNNAGKSRALREIQESLQAGNRGAVVTEVAETREGASDEMLAWLETVSARADLPPGAHPHLVGRGGQVSIQQAEQLWSHGGPLHTLTPFLLFRADAESRLNLAGGVQSVDALTGPAIEPLQRLLTDHASEERLSASVERAFGSPITVNRAGGSTLHLLLGRPSAEARLDNPEYLRDLQASPLIEQQGDGMRSFVGLLLSLTATEYPVVLIDEPEAFLHPPQAREMGRQLAAPSGQQRIVATHDSDVLMGLLDSGRPLTIVRLRRSEDSSTNVPSVLDSARVRELWNDPFLRYSNLLDGLFHRGVVVCEAEGDARLYTAALDASLESDLEPASDLLFAECGGKHKLRTAVDAVRPMGVPTAVISDIDVLREEGALSELVHALGGDWEQFKPSWEVVSAAVSSLPTDAPLSGDVRDQIEQALGDDRTARLTEAQTRRIRNITKSSDGWKRVRKAGLDGLPNGDPRQAANQLTNDLAEIGLFIVPVGALEGWAPQVGGHGSRFVSRALDERVHENEQDLHAFVRNVAEYLHALA